VIDIAIGIEEWLQVTDCAGLGDGVVLDDQAEVLVFLKDRPGCDADPFNLFGIVAVGDNTDIGSIETPGIIGDLLKSAGNSQVIPDIAETQSDILGDSEVDAVYIIQAVKADAKPGQARQHLIFDALTELYAVGNQPYRETPAAAFFHLDIAVSGEVLDQLVDIGILGRIAATGDLYCTNAEGFEGLESRDKILKVPDRVAPVLYGAEDAGHVAFIGGGDMESNGPPDAVLFDEEKASYMTQEPVD